MGVCIPTESELVRVLCDARTVDWRVVAHGELAYAQSCRFPAGYRAVAYRDFLSQFLVGAEAIPEIPMKYMSGPSAWEDMRLSDICSQISGAPVEYQGYLKSSIDRYRKAVMKLLPATAEWPLFYDNSIDPVADKKKWERIRDIGVLDVISLEDLPEQDLDQAKYHFIGKMYSVRSLFQKAMILQKLQELVMGCMAEAGSGAPATQAEEPAADRGRGRKVRLPMDVFDREIFPVLDKEFPFGGNNVGIRKRCGEIGKQYGVSESCIKGRFYTAQINNRGNKSG